MHFKVSGVLEYHKAITMDNFMKELAPRIWPPSKRIGTNAPFSSLEDNASNLEPFADSYALQKDVRILFSKRCGRDK